MLRKTPTGALIDMLAEEPALCHRILTRLDDEAGRIKAPESVSKRARARARFYLSTGLPRFKMEVQEMASASDHRAFCWCVQHKASAHIPVGPALPACAALASCLRRSEPVCLLVVSTLPARAATRPQRDESCGAPGTAVLVAADHLPARG